MAAFASTPTLRALLRAMDAIKAARGWTDKQLAAAIGIKACMISNWRSGNNGISEATAGKVRRFLVPYAKKVAETA